MRYLTLAVGITVLFGSAAWETARLIEGFRTDAQRFGSYAAGWSVNSLWKRWRVRFPGKSSF